MIVSHRYKFIFIKTSKTAGTSLEIALSQFCGAEDIITANAPKDEELRQQLGYQWPQNYQIPYSKYRLRDWIKSLLKRQKWQLYNHSPARDVKHVVGEAIWNDYYKFCFERNPWDRVVSLYYWRNKGIPQESLAEFINSRQLRTLQKNGYEMYTIAGEIAVDQVFLYEKMDEALDIITARVGFPQKPQLPQAKSGFRPQKQAYQEIFEEADRHKIAKMFAKEIALCGYEF